MVDVTSDQHNDPSQGHMTGSLTSSTMLGIAYLWLACLPTVFQDYIDLRVLSLLGTLVCSKSPYDFFFRQTCCCYKMPPSFHL